MWNKTLPVAVLGLLCAAGRLPAQIPGDSVLVYEREVFTYQAAGRPDPFRSLLDSAELGLRFEDLRLVGVLYNPDPRRSVAVLTQTGAERRIRVRVGDRIGGIRVVAIGSRSVDLVVEEFGVARRETLELTRSDPENGS